VDNDELPSVLLATATLIVVLVGSLLFAMANLTEGDEPDAGGVIVRPDCLTPDGCREASDELRAAYNDPNGCDGAGARVCLVPLGDVPKDVVDMLVEHYRRTYGLTVHVAQPLDLRTGFDRRRQLEESLVWAQVRDAYSKYASDRSVTLIGLVPVDIYLGNMADREWGFGRLQGEMRVGTAGIDYRGGMISMFRMDPQNWDLPADDALRDLRLRKMVSKYIALGHYNLPLSSDPTSVTYSQVGGLADLDIVNERIPIR
jgi:hypothetical protein